MKLPPHLALLRPHQWSKNILVFAPAFFGHRWELASFTLSLHAALCFCLLASSVYCFNDVLDSERDSQHKKKSTRPVASGNVAKHTALLIGTFLLALAFLWAGLLSESLSVVLAIYLLLQLVYILWAKHWVIIDVLILSSTFVLRVLAGVSVTLITPSSWIILLTWMSCLMLALGKRYSELNQQGEQAFITRPVLAKYPKSLLEQLVATTAMSSLLLYLLWCSETVAQGRFSSIVIYPSSALVAYGLLRYQLLITRKEVDEDPTLILFRDTPLRGAILLFIGYLGLALYL